MGKKYEKAEQWQKDRMAPLIHSTFAATDLAINLSLELIEEIKKRKGLMRQQVKMLCRRIRANIHTYQIGSNSEFGESIGVLADFNDGMCEYMSNSIEILRLSFRSLFVRVGARDPDLSAAAETAVSLCAFAAEIYKTMCRRCVNMGLQNPRRTTTQYIDNKSLQYDVRRLADILHKANDVPHMDFTKDEASVKAFDAVTARLVNGKKIREISDKAEGGCSSGEEEKNQNQEIYG